MTTLKHLATSKNRHEVFVNLESSHAATHFKDSPKLMSYVEYAIPHIELQMNAERIEFNTHEIVGKSDLVETTLHDDVVYALRPYRDRYSRFVKHKEAQDTSWIAMAFEKLPESDGYELYTAFIGRLTPSFPGGDYLPEQSREFWSKHALVWGKQEIVPGSETEVCPW